MRITSLVLFFGVCVHGMSQGEASYSYLHYQCLLLSSMCDPGTPLQMFQQSVAHRQNSNMRWPVLKWFVCSWWLITPVSHIEYILHDPIPSDYLPRRMPDNDRIQMTILNYILRRWFVLRLQMQVAVCLLCQMTSRLHFRTYFSFGVSVDPFQSIFAMHTMGYNRMNFAKDDILIDIWRPHVRETTLIVCRQSVHFASIHLNYD